MVWWEIEKYASFSKLADIIWKIHLEQSKTNIVSIFLDNKTYQLLIIVPLPASEDY